jgi:hypothetical protein
MLHFPPDLYPHLVAVFFRGGSDIVGSIRRSPGYGFNVMVSNTLKKPIRHRQSLALLACTCKALHAAVRENLVVDARLPLILFWKQVRYLAPAMNPRRRQ